MDEAQGKITLAAAFAEVAAITGSAIRARRAIDKAILDDLVRLTLNGKPISKRHYAQYLRLTDEGAIEREPSAWRISLEVVIPFELLPLRDGSEVRWTVSVEAARVLCDDLAATSARQQSVSSAPPASLEAMPEIGPDPFRTGAQGRPTAKHFIQAEARRRIADAGKTPLPEGVGMFAESLAAWWKDERLKYTPPGPEMTAGAIENTVRAIWNSRPIKL